MGTKNKNHRRKGSDTRGISRQRPGRKLHPAILIVCEGEKTEPNYFKGLKSQLELRGANIEITGDSDSSPINVVNFSEKRYLESRKRQYPFDKVFCVFDKNNHKTYQQALTKIKHMKHKNAKGENVFCGVTSVPSFEYFLLLHYEYTDKPFNSKDVISRLRIHVQDYDKGNKDVFDAFSDKLETAKRHAKKSLIDARERSTDNPSTKAHKLVEFMQKMAT